LDPYLIALWEVFHPLWRERERKKEKRKGREKEKEKEPGKLLTGYITLTTAAFPFFITANSYSWRSRY